MVARQLLVTGGSGLLGAELQKLLPDAYHPSSNEFNVTDCEQMAAYVRGKNISMSLPPFYYHSELEF